MITFSFLKPPYRLTLPIYLILYRNTSNPRSKELKEEGKTLRHWVFTQNNSNTRKTTAERTTNSKTTSTNSANQLCTAFFRTTCNCGCCPLPLCRISRIPALPSPTCYAHALPALHTHANGLQSLRISAASTSTGLPSATVLPTSSTAGVSSSGLPSTTSPRLP